MLCEQVSGKLHDFDTTGKTLEFVDIEWQLSKKYIRKQQIKEQKWEFVWTILFSPEVCIRMM